MRTDNATAGSQRTGLQRTGSQRTDFHWVSFDPIAPPLTPDVVQDYPAAWDWRLVVGFVIAGAAALYLI